MEGHDTFDRGVIRGGAMRGLHLIAAVGLALGVLACDARAVFVDTVDWAPDGTVDGTGTGTLGAVTVTYTTVVGGNAGISFAVDWNNSLPTNDAVGTGVTNQEAGVLGTLGVAALQIISFSGAVTDPILYVNFVDDGTSIDLAGLSFTELDANNASFSGSVYTFAGAVNSTNDGFAVLLSGTFGPGTPVTFTYTTPNAVDTVGFTVGTSVPEPGSVALLGIGGLGLLGYGWRRRRRAAA
jgi:hypothetical protein